MCVAWAVPGTFKPPLSCVSSSHSQALNVGVPPGIQVAHEATQYSPFKGIHCRLIGITWLEMLTLVFLKKVSINL